ncbi:MAG: amino acid ABC transporter permease [Eubacteriales bacterium]
MIFYVSLAAMDYSSMVSFLLEGTLKAVELFFLTIVLSLPLGLLVARLRLSKIVAVQIPVKLYLLIMRGTPLILQLMFFMFFPPLVLGIPVDRFTVAVFSFTVNYAAYFAEIYRGGIESIPVGQQEAAYVLGFSPLQTFVRITLPQVVKRIIPTIANESMTLVKDTALASVIGVTELFRNAESMKATYFSVVPIAVAGLFYLIMNSVVAAFYSRVEKKLNYYKG